MAEKDEDSFTERCEAFGVFTNLHTLEVDLFNDSDFTESIVETLREQKFGPERQGMIDGWVAKPKTLDVAKYLALIEVIGKGRFAQRLASRVMGVEPPIYIRDAIKFVADRV